MDIVNQLLDTIKASDNPEMYYVAVAMVLILTFYIVGKILRIITFFMMIGMAVVGFNYMQGKDVNQVLAALSVSANKIVSSVTGTASTAISGAVSGNSSDGNTMNKVISDVIDKAEEAN